MSKVDFDCERFHDINDFLEIMEILRAPDGCPWDSVQTHESIRQDCLEEAYEVCEAIDEKNTEHLKEELGDLLMQVIFHASIEQEKGNFNFNDVCNAACTKLIHRHPHVFIDSETYKNSEKQELWDKAKMEEHGHKTVADEVNGVAKSLPAVWRAQKMLKKAKKGGVNFEFNADEAFKEYKKSIAENENQSESFGKLIFALLDMANNSFDSELAVHGECDNYGQKVENCVKNEQK